MIDGFETTLSGRNIFVHCFSFPCGSFSYMEQLRTSRIYDLDWRLTDRTGFFLIVPSSQ